MKTAEGEFFIPFDKLNGAFDGDMVEVSPARQERSKKALARAASSTRKREARVKRVIEHAHPEIIGRYEVAEPFGVVVPEDPRIPYDIFTLRSESASVPDGAIVRVAIETYPSRKEAATGRVEKVVLNGVTNVMGTCFKVASKARLSIQTNTSSPHCATYIKTRSRLVSAVK